MASSSRMKNSVCCLSAHGFIPAWAARPDAWWAESPPFARRLGGSPFVHRGGRGWPVATAVGFSLSGSCPLAPRPPPTCTLIRYSPHAVAVLICPKGPCLVCCHAPRPCYQSPHPPGQLVGPFCEHPPEPKSFLSHPPTLLPSRSSLFLSF